MPSELLGEIRLYSARSVSLSKSPRLVRGMDIPNAYTIWMMLKAL